MKKALVLTLSALLVAGMAGCAAEPAGQDNSPATLVWALDKADAVNFDPHRTGSGDFLRSLYPVYDRLIHRDHSTGELLPGLAESWERGDDGQSITLVLRQGVAFHDGEPFNAEAVKANIERAKNVDNAIRDVARRAAVVIKEVEVVDDHTVVLHRDLEQSLVTWGLMETNLSENIGMMISPKAFDNPDLDRNPVGAGPFILESISGEVLTFVKSPDYWDADSVKLDKLVITNEGDSEADFAGLQTGEYNLAKLSHAQTARLGNDPMIDVQTPVGVRGFSILINEDMEPFNDRRIRQAFLYGVDREGILSAIAGGNGEVNPQMLPSTSRGFNPDFGADHYPYDPELAAKLVKEAGYPNGVDIVMELGQDADERKAISEVMKEQLAAIGIRITWELEQPSEESKYLTGKVPGTVGFGGQIEPLHAFSIWFDESGSYNPGGKKDDLTQELIEKVALSSGDERWDAIRELSGYVADEAFVPRYYIEKAAWGARCLTGWEAPIATYVDLRNVGIEANCR